MDFQALFQAWLLALVLAALFNKDLNSIILW